ncbi:hypothetical protein ACRALDRAFT_206871 [Sodiomyces alcalophilus JCM 7366]|uniref:uncharacterized protein n=1 Tax=Sodiomyces alcalophilus JCM 7366 TaxID=591952 RepID=UPI0039B5DCA9
MGYALRQRYGTTVMAPVSSTEAKFGELEMITEYLHPLELGSKSEPARLRSEGLDPLIIQLRLHTRCALFPLVTPFPGAYVPTIRTAEVGRPNIHRVLPSISGQSAILHFVYSSWPGEKTKNSPHTSSYV